MTTEEEKSGYKKGSPWFAAGFAVLAFILSACATGLERIT